MEKKIKIKKIKRQKKRKKKKKTRPIVKGKRRRRRRQCVLERAKGLTGFDYSLTVGPLNMCVFTKMLS